MTGWSRFSGKDRCSPGPDGAGTRRQLDLSLADLPLIAAGAPPPAGRVVERRSRHLGLIWCQQQSGRAQGEQAGEQAGERAGCPAVHSVRQELLEASEEV